VLDKTNFLVQIAISFGAGFLSFFSACIAPLIPAYICFITGLSFEELHAQDALTLKNRRAVLTESLLFVLGFSIVFVALGASASFLGAYLFSKQNIIKIVGAVVIIVFGIHMTGVLNVGFLQREKKIHLTRKPLMRWGSVLVGMAFGFGWTPCVGPILGGILVLAASRESLYQGIVLLSFYSLGLAIPFLLVSAGVGKAVRLFSKMKRYFRLFSVISGILLIVIGLIVLFGSR
jgi:cytochrome c-type biogenesis protein